MSTEFQLNKCKEQHKEAKKLSNGNENQSTASDNAADNLETVDAMTNEKPMCDCRSQSHTPKNVAIGEKALRWMRGHLCNHVK